MRATEALAQTTYNKSFDSFRSKVFNHIDHMVEVKLYKTDFVFSLEPQNAQWAKRITKDLGELGYTTWLRDIGPTHRCDDKINLLLSISWENPTE